MKTSRSSLTCIALAAMSLVVAGCADSPAGGALSSGGVPPTVAAADGTPTSSATPRSSGPAAQAAPPASVAASRAASPGKTRDITFDTIKFPMDKKEPFKRSMITPQIEALKGRAVRIRGYIFPTNRPHVSHFILVRDNQECCFGPNAALYDCVAVQMEEGQTTEYSLWPVAVEGVFDVKIMPGPDDRPLAIYHLQATSVR